MIPQKYGRIMVPPPHRFTLPFPLSLPSPTAGVFFLQGGKEPLVKPAGALAPTEAPPHALLQPEADMPLPAASSAAAAAAAAETATGQKEADAEPAPPTTEAAEDSTATEQVIAAPSTVAVDERVEDGAGGDPKAPTVAVPGKEAGADAEPVPPATEAAEDSTVKEEIATVPPTSVVDERVEDGTAGNPEVPAAATRGKGPGEYGVPFAPAEETKEEDESAATAPAMRTANDEPAEDAAAGWKEKPRTLAGAAAARAPPVGSAAIAPEKDAGAPAVTAAAAAAAVAAGAAAAAAAVDTETSAKTRPLVGAKRSVEPPAEPPSAGAIGASPPGKDLAAAAAAAAVPEPKAYASVPPAAGEESQEASGEPRAPTSTVTADGPKAADPYLGGSKEALPDTAAAAGEPSPVGSGGAVPAAPETSPPGASRGEEEGPGPSPQEPSELSSEVPAEGGAAAAQMAGEWDGVGRSVPDEGDAGGVRPVPAVGAAEEEQRQVVSAAEVAAEGAASEPVGAGEVDAPTTVENAVSWSVDLEGVSRGDDRLGPSP